MRSRSINPEKLNRWYFVCGKGNVGKTAVAGGMALQLSRIRNGKFDTKRKGTSKTATNLDNKSLLSQPGRGLYIDDDSDGQSVKNTVEKKIIHEKQINTKNETYANEHNDKILLISPDNLEKLSITFGCVISKGITQITENLDVLEIKDEKIVFKESNLQPVLNSILELPGIKESIFISKAIEQSKDYRNIVIDTWPSFSFLNFLSFPKEISTLLNKIANLDQCEALKETEFYKRIAKIVNMIEESQIVKNSSFTLVCIPEGLSLTETKMMIDRLSLYDINIEILVINQILKRTTNCSNCEAITVRQENIINKLRKLPLKKIEIDFKPGGINGFEQLKRFADENF